MDIIHIVLGKANPERMNGVNRVVYQLATKQVEAGLKTILWGIATNLENNYGKRNFETKLFKQSINPFLVSKELKLAIRQQHKDTIFHLHGGWIPIFSSICKILDSDNISFVFTPHGAYNIVAMKRNYWLKKIYFRLFEQKILLKTAKIHCIGKSEIIGLSQFFSIRKAILLPYGYQNKNPIIFTESPNRNIVFGFMGRLDIYTKGLDILIEAFELFSAKNPNAQLWIVGDSKEKYRLERIILKKNLKEKIILFGSKFGKEKELLLAQIDVFVHPSRNEGLPLSVIEVLSLGKPCIVTQATNIGDLVTAYQAGKTIHSQNSIELEVAMCTLNSIWQNPPVFYKMQQNAIAMIEENYDWNKIIQQYNQELYMIP
jgi:glycosyltransferase involved in cell wall biosynthesis